MLGAGLHFGRGEDRFYNPVKARRNHQNQLQQRHRSGGGVGVASAAAAAKGSTVISENREPESRSAGSDEAEAPGSAPVRASWSNLDRFLKSTTPSVPAQYPSKVILQCLIVSVLLFLFYFILADVFFLLMLI